FFLAAGWAVAAEACAADLAPLPRLGVGGGGGGGGAKGFKKFRRSVRERNLPSSRRRNTSSAIFGYWGSCGVINSSVISGNGSFCCTSLHLVKKFLIFCATTCCRAVIARKRTISGRALDSSFQVREGVAASLPVKRLAKSLALSSRSRQASARSRRGIVLRMSAASFSLKRAVRKCNTAGAGSGAYPSSFICWRVFISCISPLVSTFTVVQCGLSTLSQPSFSRTR